MANGDSPVTACSEPVREQARTTADEFAVAAQTGHFRVSLAINVFNCCQQVAAVAQILFGVQQPLLTGCLVTLEW